LLLSQVVNSIGLNIKVFGRQPKNFYVVLSRRVTKLLLKKAM